MINQLVYVTSLYCGEKCAWSRDAVDKIWRAINWKFSGGRIHVNSDKLIYHTPEQNHYHRKLEINIEETSGA